MSFTGQEQAWIDVVNRGLFKIAHWEELVKDKSQWRSIIHQVLLLTSSKIPI